MVIFYFELAAGNRRKNYLLKLFVATESAERALKRTMASQSTKHLKKPLLVYLASGGWWLN